MQTDQKQQHFKNLLTIAFSDGVLDKAELEFLFSKSDKYFITLKDIEGMADNAMHPPASAFEPDEDIRAGRMLELVEMMLIDGEAHERERRLCTLFCVSLGYNAERAEDLVNNVEEKMDAGATETELLAFIKSFK
jgi:uncharacterized tellurite resistance protein B-like protein